MCVWVCKACKQIIARLPPHTAVDPGGVVSSPREQTPVNMCVCLLILLIKPGPVAGCFLPPHRPPASSADLGGHPPFPKGSVRAPPAGQECWRQLTPLGRPALTREMVVHLVTFGFFPGILASFAPHAQGQGSQG